MLTFIFGKDAFPAPTMLFTFILLTGLAVAGPMQKRSLSTQDKGALSLAMYLENLEYALFSAGCNNFTDADYSSAGYASGFHENVCIIASQERAHAQAIGSVLSSNGYDTISPCTYQFPYSNASDFVDLANKITAVGIGAYLGATEVSTLSVNCILRD